MIVTSNNKKKLKKKKTPHEHDEYRSLFDFSVCCQVLISD